MTLDTQDMFYGFVGGGLIGLGAGSLLLFNGRIAGISGIYGGLLRERDAAFGELAWRFLFVAGLVLGGVLLYLVDPEFLPAAYEAGNGLGVVALGGLLVGFGTRLGSGCTSGHGVCGVARLSPRSLVATALFVLAGMFTATTVAAFATPYIGV